MPEKRLILEFIKDQQPYNTKLTLDLSMLKKVIPLLQKEILAGRVDTAGEEIVILHLNLDKEKLGLVESMGTGIKV